MPGKLISWFGKPRSLRFIVFFLVSGTALLSVIFVFTGYFLNNVSVPTPSTHQNDDGLVMVHDNAEGFRDEVIGGSKNRTRAGKCDKFPYFIPDMDSNIIYPSLPFDAKWIDNKDYWDTFFEQRYRMLKEENDQPILKVFVIPHSHTDPGWLHTFEEYFHNQVRSIIDNAVDKLEELQLMKFQLSEISFLDKWYKYAHPSRRKALKQLVEEGRLEIATGGWVMTDEATVNLYSMIDQLVEGHQWVKTHLGVIPKTSWSIDPFGHGSTFPFLLASSGIDGMIIQRIHYAWKKYLAEKQKEDFKWVQRWDSDKVHDILCHNNPFDIYSIKHSCGPHPQICLNFDFRNIKGSYSENFHIMTPITRNNLKQKSELLLEQYSKQASLFPHNVIMVSLGDDFRYDHAIEWNQQYFNYLTMFNYINAHRDIYKAEIQFGTISEYFKEIRQRADSFPTFSGDFFTYSDIFSGGGPSYWSGYFGTRPYWKKFYRETENALRSAEILYSYAIALARQKGKEANLLIMNREYTNLVTARQWLALFAHHDATTGTSKAKTMNDYGLKLLEAKQNSMRIQMLAISSILYGESAHSHLSLDYEQATFGVLPKKAVLKFSTKQEKKVVLFNNLGWQRSHLVKIVVATPYVSVLDMNGRLVQAQVNPIMDLWGSQPLISSTMFELTFIGNLPPFSINTYTIKAESKQNPIAATLASIYCRDCVGPRGLFDIHSFQAGNIQLTNNYMNIIFDRNTGFLLEIKKSNISINAKQSFGSYRSSSYRSGAYLLNLDRNQPHAIPFQNSETKIFIISGPISSELSVSSSPLLISTEIMHSGGKSFEDAVYIQNKIDLGQKAGEVFMKFETDLNTNEVPGGNISEPVPIFYTDQNGYTVEKRIKIEKIGLHGNYYPVNTMSYIQDHLRGLRFSVLVDRAHGFASYDSGSIETLVERRTIYDDSRGMGEGVTDNRETVSNYVITLENIGQLNSESYENSVPTMAVHQLSHSLSYPPSLFILDYENFPEKFQSTNSFHLFTEELPCDTHLINLRTMSEDDNFDVDTNLPSTKALMIIHKLGYYCLEIGNCGNGNSKNQSLFFSNTSFNRLSVQQYTETALTGIDNRTFVQLKNLDDFKGGPFEIKSLILSF